MRCFGWIECTVLFAMVMGSRACAAPLPAEIADWSFISNGEIKLGVRTNSGACIGFFSEVSPERNLLNHYDRGRFIQQSYYGTPDGSLWNKKPWRWNPVQGGDWKGNGAKLLSFENKGRSLYAKSMGKHWANGEDLPEVTFEEWISLTGKVAHIRFKMSYTGATNHPPHHQELPAVFVDYELPNLVYYKGGAPWTGAALTRKVPGWPNEHDGMDENWAAYVDAKEWGIGVFVPGFVETTHYRYQGNSKGGPTGAACSYFAPVKTMAITNGMTFEYDVYLMIGKVAAMREVFGKLRDARKGRD